MLSMTASMGPRRWSRGRGRDCRAERIWINRLQWGHGDGAVEEMSVGLPDSNKTYSLQWGHGDGAVEEGEPRLPPDRKSWTLQWGHGDGAVEERSVPGCRLPWFQASMGPRRWSRGRDGVRTLLSPDEIRFNGATAMEPWKSREDRRHHADHTAMKFASMGPRRWSRGRGNGTLGKPSRWTRFNGATAMEPWKRQYHCIHFLHHLQLQWGHGDGAVEEMGTDIVYRHLWMLQWGHGDGAVEEEDTPQVPGGTVAASMGPRRWSRGRGGVCRHRFPSHKWLQWGHGDGAVEESKLA